MIELRPIPREGLAVDAPDARLVVDMTVALYGRSGFTPPWTGYLAFENGVWVGSCGFNGPPKNGEAEIAYGTRSGGEGRGIATELARRLTAIVEAEGFVPIAHTMPSDGASPAILRKLGYVRDGVAIDPDEGEVWRWRRVAPVVSLYRVRSDSAPAGLDALLVDAVDGGASVGFLRPLAIGEAADYWRETFAALGDGLALWVAEADGVAVGTVQLALCGKPNGRHRAEVQKLMVRTDRRGKGIASRLLEAAESCAAASGRTLLVLDTEVGSAAEALYARHGWTRGGEIPDYATTPDGVLHPTVYYWKRL